MSNGPKVEENKVHLQDDSQPGNRAYRRGLVAQERRAPELERKRKIEEELDRQKKSRQDSVARKQAASHARAVARKEAAKKLKT